MAFGTSALRSLFRGREAAPPPPEVPLYIAVVDIARNPDWFTAGGVPDTIDGRFDMVVLILSLVHLRLETGPRAAVDLSVSLTERFVADMDGTMRQIGIGDLVVGKHIGRLVGALGGRLGAYRAALGEASEPDAFETALVRNLYRGERPGEHALAWTAARARAFHRDLERADLADIMAARLPNLEAQPLASARRLPS
jgi:cytochrome b pre-mRNA-processing protein 3